MVPFQRFTSIFVVLAVLAVLSSAVMAQAQIETQQVENLRIWHSPDKTRVVFDVSANVTHQMFSLQNPLRLVVDIENADLSIKLPSLDSNNEHILAIRSGRPNDKVLRFVFELKKPMNVNDFVLSPNELYGHRLVVDLQEEIDSLAPTVPKRDPIEPPRQAADQPASSRAPSSPQIQKAKPILIAIDAGHGGEDPGALGHRGSREKKITLEIAKRLKNIIDDDPLMQSYMVRQGDYYIKLDKRRSMARAANADMFISIHADAFKRRSARGFSVFALSPRGATSAKAQRLAEKENASDLIGGVSLADKEDVLKKVLVDLTMTNTIGESVNLGGRVIKELGKLGRLHSKHVEQAGFVVLKSAEVPSILVECGFITNPDEERNLKSSRYQQKLAKALYKAISEYYQQTPHRSIGNYAAPSLPSSRTNSLLEPKMQPSHHKVVRGDSLSKIALRYGTTVGELKKLNKLRSNTAVLGKRLKLPISTKHGQLSSAKTRNTSSKPVLYTVKSGDSFSKISLRFNVTIKSLKTANNLRNDTLFIGQILKIPGGRVAVPVAVSRKTRTHKVKSGDTLSEIAERYDSSMVKIMQANSLSSRNVMLGQVLKIPN